MQQIVVASLKALKSLWAPGMMGILISSLLITLAVLAGFIFGSAAFFSWAEQFFVNPFLAQYLGWIGGIGAFFLAWFLFPTIMPLIINFYDDRIARTIERVDYPQARPLENLPLIPELLHDAKFTIKALLLNILVLPLYLVPLVNVFLFYVLNGYLLGREFFVMVARRYMPVAQAEALRRQHARVTFTGGVLLAIGATIPFVNLIAPFWGIAVMTHLFHQLDPEHRHGRLITQ